MKLTLLVAGVGIMIWGASAYGMEDKKGNKKKNHTSSRPLYIPNDKKTLLRNMYHDINGLHKKITVVLGNLEESKKREKQLIENQIAITNQLAEQKTMLKVQQESIKEQSQQITQLVGIIQNYYEPFAKGKKASSSRLNDWIGNANTK